MLQPAQNPPSPVGKRVRCPRCGKTGTIKVKQITRKETTYQALYVYHYDPQTRKITWHYLPKHFPGGLEPESKPSKGGERSS
jgi:hypothetical protein